MKPFCKLFDSATYGQILVRADTDDDGDPALIVSVRGPAESGVDIAQTCVSFIDCEAGWNARDKMLEACDLPRAELGARTALSPLTSCD